MGKRVLKQVLYMCFLDPSSSSLFRLSDGEVTPDPYHTSDYEAEHRGKGTPLVIDNGEQNSRSSHCSCYEGVLCDRQLPM